MRERQGGGGQQPLRRRVTVADTETNREKASQRVKQMFGELQAVQATAVHQATAKSPQDKNDAKRAAQKLKDLWQKLRQAARRRPSR